MANGGFLDRLGMRVGRRGDRSQARRPAHKPEPGFPIPTVGNQNVGRMPGNLLKELVTPARFERAAPRLGILCSILLSYGVTGKIW